MEATGTLVFCIPFLVSRGPFRRESAGFPELVPGLFTSI